MSIKRKTRDYQNIMSGKTIRFRFLAEDKTILKVEILGPGYGVHGTINMPLSDLLDISQNLAEEASKLGGQ